MNAKRTLGERGRLFVLTLGLALVFWLLYALRSVVFPFALGLVLAYVLLPVVSWAERRLPHRGKWLQTKRVSAIVLLFLVFLALFSLLIFYVGTTLVNSLAVIVQNATQYTSSALLQLNEWIASFHGLFPPEMQQQVDNIIKEAGTAIGNAVKDTFMKGLSLIPGTFGLILGFFSLPIFLFYILRDWSKLRDGLYSNLPTSVVEYATNILSIIGKVIGQYVRAQLLLALIVGGLDLAGLLILQVPFAPVLAVFAGATEVIPMLGPWIGGITAVMVTLALAPEKAIWVAILFASVQLLENIFLVPRIQGGRLNIHPAIAIVLLVVGTYLAGFWGLILSVPLASAVAQIYKYVLNAAKEQDAGEVNTSSSFPNIHQ